tara:strand:- start:295 stop:720 length:426 start_codon:yes stop_codon:yes gene_type:complete
MIKFKKIIKKTLLLISRIIYWIIPSDEFKPSKKEYIIYDIFKNEEQNKCYKHFKKYFKTSKKIPKLNKNVVLVNGLAQNTLDNFLKENNPKINFVNMDMYTYETSRFILSKIKPYLIDNSVILFNHLYNFPAWDVGEYKAL